MSGGVRTYWVSQELWNDQPATAAKLIAEQTAEYPGDLWLIAIGPADARPFLDNLLFMYGSPVDIEDHKFTPNAHLPWNESNPEWWKIQVETRGEVAWEWLVNEWGVVCTPPEDHKPRLG